MMNEEEKVKLEKRWHKLREVLGYTDEEMKIFQSEPKKVMALREGVRFATHDMVIEIIEAHNCVMGYKPGDRFVVDREGALVLDRCPSRLCVGAIAAFKTLTDRMIQAFYDGKSEVLIDTVHCPDVGVREGGWGMVTMRIRSSPREKK